MSKLLKKNQEERNRKKRNLTPCIQTRWYRAPEVILMDKAYDQSADIWGLGLIIAEVMRSCNNYKQPANKKRFLFKGKSCYPISPIDKKDTTLIDEHD
jgi:serine/threonine protein kinase